MPRSGAARPLKLEEYKSHVFLCNRVAAYYYYHYTFVINHNFKVSPSAACVPAANAIFKDIDILTKIIFRSRIFYNITFW
jgi:hypothetical protein